jgi:deoxyribodipyrimidine photo-lyase
MQPLERIENHPRVFVRRKGTPFSEGRCVVYWMRRSLRAQDNPALDAVIAAANALAKPVVVFFGLVPIANANLRHYSFLVHALSEIQDELSRRSIGFVLRRYPDHSVVKFCADVGAALLVVDENPLRGAEQRLHRALRELRIPVWSVDSDVVVPSRMIDGKQYAARVIRPRLLKLLPAFLVPPENLKVKIPWRSNPAGLRPDSSCLGALKIDRSVQPVKIQSGPRAALKSLQDFVTSRLAQYPKLRNHPEVSGTSHLSPYLHFGQISPVRIALEVENSAAPRAAKEAFLDQLITWRELAVNFVRNNELYDSLECGEAWAQRTLAQHAQDERPVLFNERQLQNAETCDPLWNAAQIQMVEHGWMHNYMRMYWAKKILEWTRSPAEAFHLAVRLNDKYEIDGRDPNGYAGIAWAIAGKLDRPWFDRPIFGQIRYMSAASAGKKFDSKKYIAQNSRSGTAALEEAPQGNLFQS